MAQSAKCDRIIQIFMIVQIFNTESLFKCHLHITNVYMNNDYMQMQAAADC